jgi:hypothetical protein
LSKAKRDAVVADDAIIANAAPGIRAALIARAAQTTIAQPRYEAGL